MIRNLGSGRYLTAGRHYASLEYSDAALPQTWNIEPDPNYDVYRFSSQDGRYVDGATALLQARAAMAPNSWGHFAISLDLVDGQPAPATVAMTAKQIEAANQHAALLNAARSTEGCWRVEWPNGNSLVVVFAFKVDALVLYSLRYTDDMVGRDVIEGGYSLGSKLGVFRPKNGVLTDDYGQTLTLSDRRATYVTQERTDQFQRLFFSAKSSGKGISEADCRRLISSVLQQE